MTADLFFALVGFAFVTSVTPGPNNLMLLASGVNFGFWRTIPHMLGVGLGFGFMILALGLGLAHIFAAFPQVHGVLRVVGGLYMLWLAWKIANSGPASEGRAKSTPMTFLGAALFQWVNPKAWAMALGAIAAYSMPANYVLSVTLISVIFVATSPRSPRGYCSVRGCGASSPIRATTACSTSRWQSCSSPRSCRFSTSERSFSRRRRSVRPSSPAPRPGGSRHSR